MTLKPITVAVIAEGDADTPDCWSGSAEKFVAALRGAGISVEVYDAALRSWPRALAAIMSYHPARRRWRQRYGLGKLPFLAKSMRAVRVLDARARHYDAVIQIGATFSVDRARLGDTLYILYCDSNIAYSRRGAPYSAASGLSEREFRAALAREKAIYDAADRIWTMSDALGESFRTDFDQRAEKIVSIYAGMNNPPAPVADARRGRRILFVGKDHERKGSRVLLQAFEVVRRAVPDAELHMVGRYPEDGDPAGVVSHGVVTRATPVGRARLDELFATSSVFCMPSHYEPFGIAFVEAMSAGLPCVGTTKWAMPEIIREGETGWLVADGAVEQLAGVLISAMRDPACSEKMGARGRQIAATRFTWERVAARAAADLNSTVEAGVSLRATPVAV